MLLQPFDIVMKVQNKDKTLSDLSINMEIQPELRGEIDSWKLGRLLKILNVVSSTFATPQSMQTSINDHQKIIGSRKSSNLFSPMNAIESSKPFTNPEGTFSPSTKIGQDLNSPHDSQKSRNSPIGRLSLSGTPNKALQLHSQTSPSCKVEEIDPNRVFLSISILMPMATLDLTYDDENGEHLILSITKMTSTLLNRAYDRQLLFDLSEIYMRDSFRAEAQQDLMWTPADGGNLIHIAYRNMFSTLSPLYKKHGTELVINFAVLGLNTDSSTITHLKPFYEVLLSARNTNHTMQNERNVGAHDHAITQLRDIDLELDTSFDRGETNQLLNSVMSPTTNPAPDRPSGVHVVASLGKISLDILRSSVQEKKGQLLEPAFAMEVSNLSADVDVAELITATVILKSFEIQDKRVSSRDYLFKKVFCPVLEDAGEAFSPISDIHSPTTIESYDARSMEMPLATNLLNIQYVQESKANSNVNITVSNVTSFISVDAILDLINVGLANTFALLDVLARKDTGIPQGYDSVDSLSSVEQSIADHSSNQPKDESKTNTMNVTVKVNNPQMILLEDPTSSESQAIVGRCGIEVTYTRMLRTWEHLTTQELVESLHVSLTNYEIFVLHSMQQKDRLHPILEPLGVELFLKRESVDKVAMFTKISIEHDSINARLSFNNLLLAQSILSRRSLVSEEEKGVKPEPKSDNFGKAVKQIPKLTRTNSAVRGNRSRSSSAITRPQMLFDLNLTSFHIIVINDFNNQNVPIMRLFSDNCKVSTEYFPAYLRNEAALSCHGSVETKIDYYNSPLTVWEPVLDSWRPTLDVTSSGISYSLVIKSEHTMQLTVSGIMLETLLRSYSLFFHNIDLNDHDESEVNSGVSVRNLLGDNIDIELFNSATKQSVMKLAAGELKKMPTEPTRGRKNWNKTFHIPSAVDLYFGGTLGEERMPLFHLPFTLNKPKPCILQPIVNLAHLLETSPHSPLARTLSVTATSYKKSSAVIVLEPIVEEVYENSRYDPIQGAWRPPFLMGDPYQWTDASCTINRDIGKLEKTSDRWEWQGKWEVDLQGVIGSEIDKDGWEYAPSFASFSIISKRRNIKPLDVARRRRWTRTRVPVAGHSEQISIRPMTAFWDVQPMKNGSRIVDIRSGMQLVNDLPFPVVIALRHSSWLELKTYGPLLSGSTFSIPILAVYANFIRIKPASDVYSWSQFTACTIHGYESYAVRDLKCDGSADSSVCFRMISRQSDKALTMTLVPYITISNRLPCDLRFRCYSTEVVKEEGIIVTGTRKKLSYISTATDAQIALKLGKFSWSQRISIQSDSDYFETIVMDIRGSDEKPGNRLALTLKGSLGVDHSVELEVFSKQILVDRTALDLFVSSKLMNEHRILRSTCSFQSAAVQNFSSIASFGTQSKDEYSLKSNDINIAGRFDGKEENSVNLLSLISTPRGLDDTKLRAVSQESDTNSSHVLHIADPDSIYNLIKDLRVNSTGKYRFSRANIGTGVYSDHDTIWKHLPVICRGKHALMTANSDRKSRANKIITFRMELSCCILLLVDLQLNLRWLGVDGYSRVSEIAISRSVSVGLKGHVVENHYAVYGKFYKEGEFVELRSNANNEKCGSCMYSVFIIPETTFENAFHSSVRSTPAANAHDTSSLNETIDRLSVRKVFEELSYQRRYCREIAERCWTEGGGAITLFHAEDNVIHLGACKGTAWSEKIGIDMMKRASTMGSVEIDNPYSQISYQLTYKMQYLPGLYSQTQMVTVMPRYCILNCMDESIWVSQRISERYWEFQPYVSEGWHKLDSTYGTGIRFRTSSTIWSLGSVDINEIGTSSLYIPYRHTFGDEKGIVLHVEVKLANPYENCSIIVVIWKEQRHYKSNSMTIENDSSIPIIVRQAGLEEEHDLAGREQLFDILVLPNSKVPFGWADPESSSELLVAAGPVMNSKNRRIATINLLTSDQMMRLPYNFGGKNAIKGEILLSVITRNGVRILHVASFQPMNDYFDETGKFIVDQSNSVEKQTPDDMSIPTYSFNVVFSSVGVSLVVEKPIRREFLSLYVDDLELKLKLRGNLRSVEFMIMDLQVDNYSETVIHPVLLRSTKKEIHYSFTADDSSYLTSDANENADISKLVEEVPFVEFTLVQEVVDDSSPIYKYAAIRILPLAVELDSGTVRLLFTDLLDDLKILTQSQALAISMPHKWINEFNENILSPYTKNCLIDVYQSKVQAQKSKIFFKKLTIHPVKITVTFIQTIFPRRYQKETLQSTALNVSMSLVGVENLQLRLKSFDVEDALESQNSLFAMIVTKSQQDILSQLTQIAGSLAVFGSPIGFARKVGKGVKAFFYEPYLGAVHGSQDFIMGLGRGTTSLFSGIVTGTMDSAVAIAGTATKGMSFLSGDSEYVRKRALKRQLNRANRGGILEGFIDGGESVLSGLASGAVGLVSKPIAEASTGGVQGFFRGIGLGLLGAAVKPMMGFTDGLTSIASGISNQVDPHKLYVHVRPPRALESFGIDGSNLVITPLNLQAAYQQQIILRRAKQNKYEDSFLAYIPLDKPDEYLVLSTVYVFWKRKSLWGRVWANISHCVYMTNAVGIVLYSGSKPGAPEIVVIPCGSVNCAKTVYVALAQNANRMGNAGKLVPVDIVLSSSARPTSGKLTEQNLRLSSTAGMLSSTSNHDLVKLGAVVNDVPGKGPANTIDSEYIDEQLEAAKHIGEIDGYRFGSANRQTLIRITGSETDILQRAKHYIERGFKDWKHLDEIIWRLIWEWECVHTNLNCCRCCVTLFINRSDSPVQISRVQIVHGKNVIIMGSTATGYEPESRLILPQGVVVVFIYAFPQSPIEVGHLKANINTAAFNAVVASTLRESFCVAKGGFITGFIEKSVSEWWCKYVVVIS